LIRRSIAVLGVNPYSKDLDKEKDDKDTPKDLKLTATYYTSTYYALMKKNKKDLKMKESDQVDLFYRSCFLYCIQIMFNMVLFIYSGM